MKDTEIKKKVMSYLGFARKSGNVVIGSDGAENAARRGDAKVVILAADASERTKKQVSDKCASFNVPIVRDLLTGDEIASCTGKRMTVSAAAVTERGLSEAILAVTASECGHDGGNTQLKERIFPHESGNR